MTERMRPRVAQRRMVLTFLPRLAEVPTFPVDAAVRFETVLCWPERW
jgi:hypothetical protein